METNSFGETTMMVVGRNLLRIENYRSIIQYSDKNIRIQAIKYQVSIAGEKLLIRYYDKEEMEVVGIFHGICLEQGGIS